jgi:hypothetical protein
MAKKLFAAAVLASAAIATSPGVEAQAPNQSNVNPKVFGKTYGQWSAEWWKWAFSVPADKNPVTDLNGEFCDENQPDGKVWFLAGSFGVPNVQRKCTIPRNRAVFYPLVNITWIDCPGTEDNLVPDSDVRNILARGTAAGDLACELRSTLDGVDISSRQILSVRTQSPKYTIPLPPKNITTTLAFCNQPIAEGEIGRAISEGYWIMLPPLSPGKHVLTLHGAGCSPTEEDPAVLQRFFETGVTYELTVGDVGKEDDHGKED